MAERVAIVGGRRASAATLELVRARVRELLKLAMDEIGEALDDGHGTTVVLAEIGDAIAFLGMAAWRAIG